jgi:hypothetical protein
VPAVDQTIEAQLNASVMFAIYFALAVGIVKKSAGGIYLVLAVAALTWVMHEHRSTSTESFHQRGSLRCTTGGAPAHIEPTKDNPFMNTRVGDPLRHRPPASSLSDAKVAAEVASLFDDGLVREQGDVYGKNASDRQFFTMPTNDDAAFRKFVYNIPPTLKQQGQNY